MNQIKTVVLLASMAGLLMLAGNALGGRQGVMIAFVFSVVMNFGAYWFSDKIVLAMYRAQPVDESTHPEFYGLVRDLAVKAGMPMPKVYIIPTDQPNAFATGRNPSHAAVAATEGIMRILTREELEGVMAHELTHVLHRDTLISAVAATIAGAIGYLAHMAQWAMIFGGRSSDDDNGGGAAGLAGSLIAMILMPIVATIIQLAISRSREFMADAGGARISGNPLALASALTKLERGASVIPMAAEPSTSHMFIVNPLSGAGGIMNLLRTHPSTEQRVARLEELARRGVGVTSQGVFS